MSNYCCLEIRRSVVTPIDLHKIEPMNISPGSREDNEVPS